MDKNVLKKFAIEQRKSLEEKVKDRLSIYYATEKDVDIKESGDTVNIKTDKGNNLVLSKIKNEHRNRLKSRIEKIGINQVIEEASFTWFNRIIAIRYMELHDFLPLTKDNESLNIRVLSSSDGTTEPDIMKNQNLHNSELDLNINFTELDKITNINDKYEKVLLSVCYKLGKVLPQIFDGETDYIDLLIPKNLLNKDSFLDKLINEVPEDNFNNIEIIGWFYQYYNQSEKDKAMKEKRAYKKNEIPYVTQIFTPDWIVKYMVENSLGRLWVEKNGDEEITKEFKYFIKDNIEIDNKGIMPENITFIDPCMGSGHILVYAFEVFVKLYMQAGYNKKDIPEKILKNNLYGLDIDDRAGQFAIISIMLKAREYDKDIFNKIEFNKLNILSIQETDNCNDLLQCARSIREADIRETAEYLIETFKNAKEIGSLLIVEDRDYDKLAKHLDTATNTVMNMLLRDSLKNVIRVAKILSKKYDVVVTNPPYINSSSFSENLKKYINIKFEPYKTDIFSAFIYRNTLIVEKNRYVGYMTPNVWMFISSYQETRRFVNINNKIVSLVQLAKGSFFKEATVDICSFVIRKCNEDDKEGIFIRLDDSDISDQNEAFLDTKKKKAYGYYIMNSQSISSIPNEIIGYWLSKNMINIFTHKECVNDFGDARQGMIPGNVNYFVRLWYEVNIKKVGFNHKASSDIKKYKKKWFPYNKGGAYRRWYGNIEHLLNMENDGYDIIHSEMNNNYRLREPELYFKKAITWSKITSGKFSARLMKEGNLFDIAGCCVFNLKEKQEYVLAFMNSIVCSKILEFLSPTLNYEVEHIKSLPIILREKEEKKVDDITNSNISIMSNDWDSFETSWDFKKHPLV